MISSELAELLEFIRGEIADGYGITLTPEEAVLIADGYGITLTPEEAVLIMAEFDRRGEQRS